MRLLDLVNNCKRIGITGHSNPDGDCAGSCCAAALFLRKVLPGAHVDIYLEALPAALEKNIPGTETILTQCRKMQRNMTRLFFWTVFRKEAGTRRSSIRALL